MPRFRLRDSRLSLSFVTPVGNACLAYARCFALLLVLHPKANWRSLKIDRELSQGSSVAPSRTLLYLKDVTSMNDSALIVHDLTTSRYLATVQ